LAAKYRGEASTAIDLASFDLNAATMSLASADETYQKLSVALGNLQHAARRLGGESYDAAMTSASRATTLFLIILAAGVALSIAVTLKVNSLILAPLREMSTGIDRVAGGDLTRTIAVETTDEIGTMAGHFNAMTERLRELLGQIHTATATIASATTQISASTEQMAAGTQEQSSQTSEVAGAVEEMTRTIVENSKNATKTAETARDARVAAEKGGSVVTATVEGMKRIAATSKQSAETVQALGRSSNQIGEIVGVIDDIADQTNLLALNAAIEAARAGEQGRGFAVVADEVRKLAERTTKATKEIADMIRTIQRETAGAVQTMEQGDAEVQNGITQADQAGSSLREIVAISQRVGDMITQIATASEEQSTTSEEIARNVEAITNVTQETARGTQQVARAAEDLNRLTANLQSLLSAFHLEEEGMVRTSGN
jgi:methyl-accepting chemotaxis protein